MKFIKLYATIAITVSTTAGAQTSSADHDAHHPAGASAAASASVMSEGEVRKIDKELGKVTLRHGPIANLDMPGMTMVFKVADAKLLVGIKEGDKVKFAADRVNAVITLTAIEAVK